MDIITTNFIKEFISNKNIKKSKIEDQFELFANYCVVNKEYDSNSFNIKNTLTGQNTQGIDGIIVIVNNKICESCKEIEDLIELNRYLNVDFIFVQSKISSKFDGPEISSYFGWIKEFFSSEAEKVFKSNEMKNFIAMKDLIYSNSSFMKDRSPLCSVYFVSTGKWVDDSNLEIIVDRNKKELDDTNLFDKVSFTPCDAKTIQTMYRKTKEPIEAKIQFEKKVTLPIIEDVKVSYSGMLPFSEFRKIIIDDNGKMKSVFEDNIRDYLEKDDNDVNNDISQTMKEKKFKLFSLLNNGVTVVAEQIAGTGDSLTIINYQIVNGCQTSHVLYEFRNIEGIDDMYVPLKIIITESSEIKSQITRATNNQTAVEVEQLEALNEFQRNLELYYNSHDDNEYKLYYERRTNQYKNSEIPSYKIINIETQIKVFSAMFANKPHIVTGYYGKIKKDIDGNMFNKEHKYDPYYISALAYRQIEDLYELDIINDQLWRFRYHILLLFRVAITGYSLPQLNSRNCVKMCNKLLKIIQSPALFQKTILAITDYLCSGELGLKINDRKTCERKNTTDKILKSFIQDDLKIISFNH